MVCLSTDGITPGDGSISPDFFGDLQAQNGDSFHSEWVCIILKSSVEKILIIGRYNSLTSHSELHLIIKWQPGFVLQRQQGRVWPDHHVIRTTSHCLRLQTWWTASLSVHIDTDRRVWFVGHFTSCHLRLVSFLNSAYTTFTTGKQIHHVQCSNPFGLES